MLGGWWVQTNHPHSKSGLLWPPKSQNGAVCMSDLVVSLGLQYIHLAGGVV